MATISYNKEQQTISVKLFLVKYKDEDGIYYVYSPELDINGYGNNESEAMTHFNYAVQDFMQYTHEHNTLEKVLKKLGWNKKVKPQSSIKKALAKNEMANIFSSYKTSSSIEEIDMPLESA